MFLADSTTYGSAVRARPSAPPRPEPSSQALRFVPARRGQRSWIPWRRRPRRSTGRRRTGRRRRELPCAVTLAVRVAMWTLRGIQLDPTPATGLVHPIPSLGCALMDIDIHTTAGKAADLARRIEEAIHSAPAAAVEKQHAKGKMTARERVLALLDEGTFSEFDQFARHRSTSFGLELRRPYGDGVVTGTGAIHGRPVCVFSQDVMIFGGALGEVYGEKICKIIDFALKTGVPMIGINEGGGARIQEGVVSLGLYAEIFRRNTLASDENDAIEYVRELISFLPQNNLEDPPLYIEDEVDLTITDHDRLLDTLIPDSANQPYDMHEVIKTVLDNDDFLETQPLFAQNLICGFGRVEGRSIGIIANQPMVFAGCLDIDASEKAARFVRTCDCFNIPVMTFVDVPGFLPGTDQEWKGIIRRGAKLLYAYSEATVPLLTIITRKAYGGAYDVMGSKHLGADINLAWPTAQIAVMGAEVLRAHDVVRTAVG